MKRRLFLLLSVWVVFSLVSILLFKPLLGIVLTQQLEKRFIGSNVSILSSRLNGLQGITFFNFTIQKGNEYQITIPELSIRYSPASLLRHTITQVSLREPSLSVRLPRKRLREIQGSYIHMDFTAPQLLLIQKLDISNLKFDIQTKDVKSHGDVSVVSDLPRQRIESCSLNIPDADVGDIVIRDCKVLLGPFATEGTIAIGNLKYNKIGISGIKGLLSVGTTSMTVRLTTLDFLQGKVRGAITFGFGEKLSYDFHLDAERLSLPALGEEFDLTSKFVMSGSVSGKLLGKGEGIELSMLDGDFSTLLPGGVLTVKDTSFLEKVARSSRQPVDLLVENFKNYPYNKGNIVVGFKGNDLFLDCLLDGVSGKRKLNVIVHDFTLKALSGGG
jgi:hypothetical protein